MNETGQAIDRELLLRYVRLISDQLLFLQRTILETSPEPLTPAKELDKAIDQQRAGLFG